MKNKTKGVIFILVALLFIFLLMLFNYGGALLFSPFGFISVALLFLSVYHFSFVYPEKRKRIAFYISLIFGFSAFLCLNSPLKGNTDIAGFFIVLFFYGCLIMTFIISLLISHFYLQLEKIKYSFLALLPISIAVIIFQFFQTFDFQRHAFSFFNISSDILGGLLFFFAIFGPISLVILLIVNIYLNRRGISESKKKKILVFYIPLIIAIIAILLTIINFYTM